LFGPETRGLPAAVRERIGAENSVFLPMRPGSRSLNLSNAVAVVAYEAWRQLGFGP
jgi:tRNA (cytidine/uridine-2'-O-)-methyltransferase